ncbi:MAG: dihydroneopterin aldolase [Gemmatimonadetes bacterium]|nr:dihydroneopterin aldolase [Gemmatimonadota bacterium]
MSNQREITLSAMRFHALVGIVPHERTVPQPIEIDLRVRLGEGDAVIDYRALYEIVAQTFLSGPIDFLEQVGDHIAQRTLDHSSLIRSVRVAVRKPHVALAGPLAYAEVVTERSADD